MLLTYLKLAELFCQYCIFTLQGRNGKMTVRIFNYKNADEKRLGLPSIKSLHSPENSQKPKPKRSVSLPFEPKCSLTGPDIFLFCKQRGYD